MMAWHGKDQNARGRCNSLRSLAPYFFGMHGQVNCYEQHFFWCRAAKRTMSDKRIAPVVNLRPQGVENVSADAPEWRCVFSVLA
jgi:hypothetical protein